MVAVVAGVDVVVAQVELLLLLQRSAAIPTEGTTASTVGNVVVAAVAVAALIGAHGQPLADS